MSKQKKVRFIQKVWRVRIKGTHKYLNTISFGGPFFSIQGKKTFKTKSSMKSGLKRLFQELSKIPSEKDRRRMQLPNIEDVEIVEFDQILEEKSTLPLNLINAPDHIKDWGKKLGD